MRGYAICTEPRSGSTFLADALTATGELGRPTEYFNVRTMREIWGVADYPAEVEQQLALIPKLGATPNGVYGFKVFSREAEQIKATRWLERLPSLSLIYLQRLDMLGQAISFVRAMQTQQWGSDLEAQAEPVYDAKAIGDELARLARSQMLWRYFFARNGLPVLHLVYEQVVSAPEQAIAAVANWIGVAPTPAFDAAKMRPLTIQRDALTEAWRARYIAQSRSLDAFP